ncbi:glycosyltransferase [Psychroserpens sp. BH13MA-6]
MTYQFTIIVPIFNEEDNLVRLGKALNAYVNIASLTTKIVLINDGSTDHSQQFIEQLCSEYAHFEFLEFSSNQGLSTALKAGFDYCSSELIGYIDADLQTAPEDFELLLPYLSTYDLVTGIRVDRHDGLIKNWSSKIANAIRRFFTQDGMDDTGCPLKVIKTDHAKNIPMFKGLHRFLPAMILLQNGTIKQVPVRHFPRTAGNSKFGFRNRLLASLSDCFAYAWMKRKSIHYDIKNKSR